GRKEGDVDFAEVSLVRVPGPAWRVARCAVQVCSALLGCPPPDIVWFAEATPAVMAQARAGAYRFRGEPGLLGRYDEARRLIWLRCTDDVATAGQAAA